MLFFSCRFNKSAEIISFLKLRGIRSTVSRYTVVISGIVAASKRSLERRSQAEMCVARALRGTITFANHFTTTS